MGPPRAADSAPVGTPSGTVAPEAGTYVATDPAAAEQAGAAGDPNATGAARQSKPRLGHAPDNIVRGA